MSVVSRKFRSTPVRSAAETWGEIVKLLAADTASEAHDELDSVSGIASALISSEAMADAAVVCVGNGPRVRVYCLYDEDAIIGEDARESSLQHCPTDGDWTLSLPAPTEDLEWVNRALKAKSNRVTARDCKERLGPAGEDRSSSAASTAVVDMEAFLRS